MIIGVEGPAGAGKSTMARTIASEIGAVVIEGGMWYRALTYEALERNVDLRDTQLLVELAGDLDVTAVNSEDGYTQIRINDLDVTEAIYSASVDKSVAIIAQQLPIRSVVEPKIVAAVRTAGKAIVVGRHLRSVIPEAAILHLTIDEQEAERRHQSRTGDSGESVAARNKRDAVTARRLGTLVNGLIEIDVTAMDTTEQADVLRQFIDNIQKEQTA